MKVLKNNKGFTLIELMVTISIIGALASIAIPRYAVYRAKAEAAHCQANRYNINMAELSYFLANNSSNLEIDSIYKCPGGGEYVWLISEIDVPGYPRIGCSIHFAQQASGNEDNIIFSSNFDTMENVTPLIGEWDLQNGNLEVVGAGEHRLAFGDETWEDYELKTNATLDAGKGYGIYFRADGERDITGYCFQFDPGYGSGAFLVRKVENGREQGPIQRVAIPEGFPVYNQSHEVSIATESDHHVIKVDGEVIFDFNDDSYSSGSGGFRSWSNSEVSFADVTVTDPDA